MKKNTLLILFVALTSFVFAQKGTSYAVDPAKSSIKWAAKKVGGGYEGTINISKGNFLVDNNSIKGGQFTIDTKSIAVPNGSDRLVNHLKNEDFFDVQKYPTANFVLTDIKKNGATTMVSGQLTIKGISKQISFPATIQYAKDSLQATATNIKIDRTQFGIQYNSGSFFADLGNKAIENDFVLNITLHAAK